MAADGSCQLTTPEGRVINLPTAACAHVPTLGVLPASTPACQLITPEGRAISLPTQACDSLRSLQNAGSGG